MKKNYPKNKNYVKMSVFVKPHEFSHFLRNPRRTLINEPRAIFNSKNNNLMGYMLEIIEESQ